MCKMASFLYKYDKELKSAQLVFEDLESHSQTQLANPTCTEKAGWYEGHYTPDNEIECRSPVGKDEDAEKYIRQKYQTFDNLIWKLFLRSQLPFSLHVRVRRVLRNHGIVFDN